MSYSALKIVAALHKVIAVLIWLSEALGLYGMRNSWEPLGTEAKLGVMMAVTLMALAGLFTFAIGEFIDLAINVATDVRL
jgi:hypothetical protein